MTLGPTDPELRRKTGGVGFQCTDDVSMVPIRHKTSDYVDGEATGRLKIAELELSDGKLQIASLYGWTGGVKEAELPNELKT